MKKIKAKTTCKFIIGFLILVALCFLFLWAREKFFSLPPDQAPLWGGSVIGILFFITILLLNAKSRKFWNGVFWGIALGAVALKSKTAPMMNHRAVFEYLKI